ncbi:hypothetical protein A2755_02950 [Candidatus Wolfebacteria bacterium RIFCSPHIGHO2_01_FULL_48_22]|uniref:Uncharacterized protein n=2 Tax=Candidatus Wolfeibacteriota TaxID=1752735 RepID=A0A1F8DU03_9BACT|nr:MAG: hypothetical protein A2755_02950 [Candidatus Wolfebacteria bacterium RIFCSPHIGHO2_01_FULL_48_22]OGM92176.1 MAG: hypothetical protein A2935_00115 [Candidatus Wolfebacteria bacterium RIFCSPLOWO2_01_FULL_47_17b]
MEPDDRYKSPHAVVTGTIKVSEIQRDQLKDFSECFNDNAVSMKIEPVFNIVMKDPKPGNLSNEKIVDTIRNETVADAYCKLLNVAEVRIKYVKKSGYIIRVIKDGKELIFHINEKATEMSDEKKIVNKIKEDGRGRLLSDEQWMLLNSRKYKKKATFRPVNK